LFGVALGFSHLVALDAAQHQVVAADAIDEGVRDPTVRTGVGGFGLAQVADALGP